MRENLCDLGLGKDFSAMIPKAWFIKEKFKNQTSSKLKTSLKMLLREWKSEQQMEMQFLKMTYLIKDFYPKYINNSKFNNKKTKSLNSFLKIG